jgi:hypothetical protein
MSNSLILLQYKPKILIITISPVLDVLSTDVPSIHTKHSSVESSTNFLGSKMSGKKKLLEREQKLPYSEM